MKKTFSVRLIIENFWEFFRKPNEDPYQNYCEHKFCVGNCDIRKVLFREI